MRQLLLLAITLALAYLSVVAYFSVKMVDSFDAEDPTNYAPDIFTSWTIDYTDPSLPQTVFSGLDDAGTAVSITHSYNIDALIPEGLSFIEWRGGILIGTSESLELWVESPGQMASHWKSEAGINSRLFKSDLGYVLEKSNNEIVVWEDKLRIPKFIFDRGGLELANDSSELALMYDAVVMARKGTFFAVKLGDRYVWVFKDQINSESVDNSELLSDDEGESDQKNAIDSSAGVLGVSRNHRTNSDMDILYDAERSLVEAIDEAGDVVWSKQVENSPIGKAYEVDIYANNKYQTAFATSSRVYLIDVEGNSVKGYPIKHSEGITGFSVIDYDLNRKHRFLVATADGRMFNYKGEGLITSGWSFAKLGGGVSVDHIKHLRVGFKDYLYAGCSDSSVLLLKRTGGIRTITLVEVNPKSTPAFRLSSSIEKSTVLFVDADGWLREHTFGDTIEVGMSGVVRADYVEMIDMNFDGKKEVVVHYNGKRTVWNFRNEQVMP